MDLLHIIVDKFNRSLVNLASFTGSILDQFRYNSTGYVQLSDTVHNGVVNKNYNL